MISLFENETDILVIIEAANTLAKLGHWEAYIEKMFLWHIENSKDAKLSSIASVGLGGVVEEYTEVKSRLSKKMQNCQDKQKRHCLALALGEARYWKPKVLEELTEVAIEGDENDRITAANLLGCSGRLIPDSTVDALITACQTTSNPKLKGWYIAALIKSRRFNDERILELISDACQHGDDETQTRIAYALNDIVNNIPIGIKLSYTDGI